MPSILKILIPYTSGHNVKSGITLLFDNLIEELSKKNDVKIYRLIIQSQKLSILPPSDRFNESLDIHNYDNAVDVLNKIKPDLVYTVPHLDFMTISFSSAAKFLGIKTFGLILFSLDGKLDLKSKVRMQLRKTFESNIPTDIYSDNQVVLGRLKFIFYKFLFMSKTFSAIKIPKLLVIIKSLKIFLLSFSKNAFSPQLPLDKHFVLNQMQKETLIELGFRSDDIIVTGHPMYDHAFKKNVIKKHSDKESIKILFAPDTLYESGMWSREQQFNTISKILTLLKKISTYSIKIKLHPSSVNFNTYEKFIHLISPSIEIFQNGSLEDFFDDADVLIVYSALTTGLIHTIPYKIPVIVCDMYDDLDDIFGLLDSGIIYRCKNLEQLPKLISKSISESEILDDARNRYVKKFLYSGDGEASKRMVTEILKLIKT